MAAAFQPIAARPAPTSTEGLVPWIRANLFANGKSTVTTIVLIVLALYFTPGLVRWAYVDAVFRPDVFARNSLAVAGFDLEFVGMDA